MPEKNQYIFRSSELFLKEDSTLPLDFPTELSDCVSDSFDLVIDGALSRVTLLADSSSKQSIASSSVSGSASSPAIPGYSWVRLRSLLAATDPSLSRYAAPASKALGLINWHHITRFCSRCGASLVDHEKELARSCPACKALVFPRLSPAIIVVVEKEGKILLARHSYRNQDMFSCLAGFLEHGETLEQCVAREVYEETHLHIRNIRYVGSQSWPYPDQYMIAFRADWDHGEIKVDPSELLEAQWFDRDNLPNTPMRGTVAWNLINGVFESMSKK